MKRENLATISFGLINGTAERDCVKIDKKDKSPRGRGFISLDKEPDGVRSCVTLVCSIKKIDAGGEAGWHGEFGGLLWKGYFQLLLAE